jgi:hypothetical protein
MNSGFHEASPPARICGFAGNAVGSNAEMRQRLNRNPERPFPDIDRLFVQLHERLFSTL